jgi:L-alanine-DL-glutamate epimerase-like enolase superfamily enzyme
LGAIGARRRGLLGLDPFDLFIWESDSVRGVVEQHADLVERLAGADVAVFDLLGKAIGRPVADVLGPRVRESVLVYDSSLYMEDLLSPQQRKGLAYLAGPPPEKAAEMVARKASWLLGLGGGVRIFKIKIGRLKWMGSFEAALERDIAVVEAVRRAVGSGVTLLVDGNNDTAHAHPPPRILPSRPRARTSLPWRKCSTRRWWSRPAP